MFARWWRKVNYSILLAGMLISTAIIENIKEASQKTSKWNNLAITLLNLYMVYTPTKIFGFPCLLKFNHNIHYVNTW